MYGLALIAALRRHGYALSPGTLDPVLPELESAGCLPWLHRVAGGPVRKSDGLTRRGEAALGDARRAECAPHAVVARERRRGRGSAR